MISLEDLIGRLANAGKYMFSTPMSVWQGDQKMVDSFGRVYETNKGFTQKQRDLILKICKKYIKQLVVDLGNDAQVAVDRQIFSQALIAPVTHTKKVYIDGKLIKVIFPYSDSIITKIREFKKDTYNSVAQWDGDIKAWQFDLQENAVHWIQNNLIDQSWEVDPKFSQYYSDLEQILDNIEEHAPRLIDEGTGYKFVNTHRSVPQPETDDVINALITANTYGIQIWSENVENRLKNSQISPILEQIIRNNESKRLEFDSSEYSINHFRDVVKYFTPTLIIIPGGTEFFTLKQWGYWLKSQNIDSKDISVLFRLPTDSGSMVNSLIKDLEFNNPIGDHTRIVFVSQKIPKPLIKSGLKFRLAINLGNILGVHYSVKIYLESVPNIVNYYTKSETGYQHELL